MSTSYNEIYSSFLSKITDFDLPPFTDEELKAYCKQYMETAIVKLPDIVHDLSKREIVDPINDVVESETPSAENPVEETETPEPTEPTEEPQPEERVTYVLHLDESAYGNYNYIVPDLTKSIANNSTFTLYVRVSNFIQLLTFTRGVSETKECKIYDVFSCNIVYNGANQFIFSKTNSTAVNYKLLYITYEEPNTESEETPQPVEIPDDVQEAIDGKDDPVIIEAEEVFTEDLTDLEKEIIASQMVVEWINSELNNTQLTRMFVGTKDETMASQANHIEKLTTLKEKRRADVSMMIRDYSYREWVKGDNT